MRRMVMFAGLLGILSGFHYFSNTYGKSDEGESVKRVLLVNDGYIVAGNGHSKGWILKVDSTGGVVWYRYLTGMYLRDLVGRGDAGFAGVASPNHDTIIFFKMNTSGEVTYSHWYTDPDHQLNFLNVHIDKCSDGKFYISGPADKAVGFDLHFYYFVILIDSSGNPIRSKLFFIGTDGSTHGEYASHNNGTNLLMSMTNYSFTGASILQIDSTMNIIWSKRVYSSDQSPYFFTPMDMSEFANGFVLAGYRSYNHENIALTAIDSSGNPLWFGVYKANYPNSGDKAIDVSSSSGGVAVAANGMDWDVGIGTFIYLKVSGDGHLSWSKRFSDPGGKTVTAGGICQTGDGPFLLGGTFDEETSSDYLVFTVTSGGDYPDACPYISDIAITDSVKSVSEDNVSVTAEPFSLMDGDYQVGGYPFEVTSLCGVATFVEERGCGCSKGSLVFRSLALERDQVFRVYTIDGRLVYSGRGKTLRLPVGVYIVRAISGERSKVVILK